MENGLHRFTDHVHGSKRKPKCTCAEFKFGHGKQFQTSPLSRFHLPASRHRVLRIPAWMGGRYLIRALVRDRQADPISEGSNLLWCLGCRIVVGNEPAGSILLSLRMLKGQFWMDLCWFGGLFRPSPYLHSPHIRRDSP